MHNPLRRSRSLFHVRDEVRPRGWTASPQRSWWPPGEAAASRSLLGFEAGALMRRERTHFGVERPRPLPEGGPVRRRRCGLPLEHGGPSHASGTKPLQGGESAHSWQRRRAVRVRDRILQPKLDDSQATSPPCPASAGRSWRSAGGPSAWTSSRGRRSSTSSGRGSWPSRRPTPSGHDGSPLRRRQLVGMLGRSGRPIPAPPRSASGRTTSTQRVEVELTALVHEGELRPLDPFGPPFGPRDFDDDGCSTGG